MTVRKAEEKDFPKIMELLEGIAALHHSGRPDLFREGRFSKYTAGQLPAVIANPDTPVFVAADENDAVAGYVFCTVKRTHEHPVFRDFTALYIDDFCVDPCRRRQGVGHLMMDAVKAYAKAERFHHIDLNVWEFNESAIRFYESCGMTTQRRYMEILL